MKVFPVAASGMTVTAYSATADGLQAEPAGDRSWAVSSSHENSNLASISSVGDMVIESKPRGDSRCGFSLLNVLAGLSRSVVLSYNDGY